MQIVLKTVLTGVSDYHLYHQFLYNNFRYVQVPYNTGTSAVIDEVLMQNIANYFIQRFERSSCNPLAYWRNTFLSRTTHKLAQMFIEQGVDIDLSLPELPVIEGDLIFLNRFSLGFNAVYAVAKAWKLYAKRCNTEPKFLDKLEGRYVINREQLKALRKYRKTMEKPGSAPVTDKVIEKIWKEINNANI